MKLLSIARVLRIIYKKNSQTGMNKKSSKNSNYIYIILYYLLLYIYYIYCISKSLKNKKIYIGVKKLEFLELQMAKTVLA